MRIDGSNRPGVDSTESQSSKKAAQSDKPATEARSSDVVHIGVAARSAKASRVRLSETVRARLEEVRAQLANKTYAIDYERLAENIADDEIARQGAR